MMPEAVKLQERKVKGSSQYLVTVPKNYVERLGWRKGDVLLVELTEFKGRRAVVYYAP